MTATTPTYREQARALPGQIIKGLVWLVVVGGTVVVLNGIDWDFLSGSTITDYTMDCHIREVNGPCLSTGWVQGGRVTYTVHVDQQFVISQINDEAPEKFDKCAIVDKQNWRCTFPRFEGFDFGFKQGKYWTASTSALADERQTRHVSKWDWTFADKTSRTVRRIQ